MKVTFEYLKGYKSPIRTLIKNNHATRIDRENKRLKEEYLRNNEIKKLHLGCGDIILESWLNVDISEHDDVMILDLRNPIPFEDSTFDYIFSEHFLEHLEYDEGMRLLKECFRILKPRGKIRTATPDMEFLFNLYKNRKNEKLKKYTTTFLDACLPELNTHNPVFLINLFFRDWGHRFIYDLNTLSDSLKKAGFERITRYKAKKSKDINLRGIEKREKYVGEENYKLDTLIVEASKP